MKKRTYLMLILTHFIEVSLMAEFTLSSSAFKNFEPIPEKYTCHGEDPSPDLSWTNPPPGTQSFALSVQDPDSPKGNLTHWLAYNIPKELTELPPNMGSSPVAINGICQGMNHFGKAGYGGPCPPPNQRHRYIFTLYALDTRLEIPPLASYAAFQEAIQSHILAKAELIGLFK